jgi:hypothetical protein
MWLLYGGELAPRNDGEVDEMVRTLIRGTAKITVIVEWGGLSVGVRAAV